MGAPDVLARLSALGVTLSTDGGSLVASPRSALTDEARELIRQHKAELRTALESPRDEQPALAAGAESRRQIATAMLEARPGVRYALVVDEEDPSYPDCVVLGVGIRSDDGTVRTCDLIVPRERYDGFALLDLIERHSGTAH